VYSKCISSCRQANSCFIYKKLLTTFTILLSVCILHSFWFYSQCVRFEFIVSSFHGTFTHIKCLSALHKSERWREPQQIWTAVINNSRKCISITLKMANFVPKWLFSYDACLYKSGHISTIQQKQEHRKSYTWHSNAWGVKWPSCIYGKESQNILLTQKGDKELLLNFNFHVSPTQHYHLGEHFGNS